jgi:hypothetical protein
MNWDRLLFVLAFVVLSCSNRTEVNEGNPAILKQFESEIVETIHDRNVSGDSISEEIVLDSVYSQKLNVENYGLTFAQYHSFDKRLDFAILGIENFKSGSAPTFLLIDYRSKQYFIDSVKVVGDSLYVYGNSRQLVGSPQFEKFKIEFDFEFDGSSFPWRVD